MRVRIAENDRDERLSEKKRAEVQNLRFTCAKVFVFN